MSKANPRKLQKLGAVQKRVAKQKAEILTTLAKIPIIQIACKRLGISRATFYRWKEDDIDFRADAEHAVNEGSISINELAQSKLIEMISQGKLSACIFWLKCRDPLFTERKQIKAEIRQDRSISQEQADLIESVVGRFAKMAEDEAKSNLKYDGTDPGDDTLDGD